MGQKGTHLTTILTLTLALLLLAGTLAAQQAQTNGSGERHGPFRFDLNVGDVLTVDKYQDITIEQRDARGEAHAQSKEEKNVISLHVVERSADGVATVEGSFHTYSRMPRLTGNFRADDDFHSRFNIDPDGLYHVEQRYQMPNLQSMPRFPDHALAIGEEWQAEAKEIIRLGELRIEIPVEANYRYLGKKRLEIHGVESHEYDNFEYTYRYLHEVSDRNSPVRRITAISENDLWFDRNEGMPIYDHKRVAYLFEFADGSTHRWTFNIDSWYRKNRHMVASGREEMRTEIERSLERGGGESDIGVRTSDEGVILDLSAILFDTDSAKLRPDAERTVARIAEVLRNHSEREIRISGHTDSRGRPQYNQELSEQRARSVVDALVDRHNIHRNRLSWRGFGQSRPVAGNDSVDGRAQNRRVEVLIVTE